MSDRPGEDDDALKTSEKDSPAQFDHMRPGSEDETSVSENGHIATRDEAENSSENATDSDQVEHLRPGETEESEQQEWQEGDPLPNADKAEIDSNKFEKYSMDANNPQNQGKSQAWEQVGYDVDTEEGRKAASEDATSQLRKELPDAPATKEEDSAWGERYSTRTRIEGPNGQEGTLNSVWQYDNGSENPRMITNWLEVDS